MQELIKTKENFIDVRDAEFNTPLHLACMHGHNDTARVLLQAGADPNARSDGDGHVRMGPEFN